MQWAGNEISELTQSSLSAQLQSAYCAPIHSAIANFREAAMTQPQLLESVLLNTIERYFELLQAHASAQEMMQHVLTKEFETGFVGGFLWRGPDGLADFLA